jgi:hypothetical protein
MELRRIKAELSNASTMYTVKGYRESQATFLFAVYRICILTSIYWDAKSNKVYRRFERLLEAAEISYLFQALLMFFHLLEDGFG